jgi:PAS domain S-box-containing protein
VGDRTQDDVDERRAAVDQQTAGLERHLAAAQQITHIGSWEWDLASNRVTWSDELYRIYGMEPRSCEITFELFLSKLVPEDRDRVRGAVEQAIAHGNRFTYPERIVRPDGSIRHLDTLGQVKRDASDRVCGLIGTCRDVTVEAQARRLRDAEQQILEMIASGAPLASVLTQLVLTLEEQAPSTIGSILLLDESGTHVLIGAAPHLPDEYNRAVHGQPIGPNVGSCGTAAFLGKPVVVSDIETDPLWADYRELAGRFGLRACWSSPILANEGRVLGTFALYYRAPRSPQPEELELIARATHIAGIAIERDHLTDQLRALTAHVEAIREDERTSVAREIHDVLGQALTALKMDIAWLGRNLDGEGSWRPKLGEMSTITDELIDCVRRISADLRPGVLDDLGLGAAIEWQAQEFQRRTGTTCVVHSNLGEVRFDRDLGTAVFRIFQEALTNVARHANASHVDVRLEQDEGRIRLSVRDDGKGISADALASSGSLGLLGMRERARRLAGTLVISSNEAAGSCLVLDLPLRTRSST